MAHSGLGILQSHSKMPELLSSLRPQPSQEVRQVRCDGVSERNPWVINMLTCRVKQVTDLSKGYRCKPKAEVPAVVLLYLLWG